MSTKNNITGEYFSVRLEEIRNSKGLAKKSFCKKIGIQPQAYSNYMSGRVPSTEMLQRIVQAFSVSGHWLLLGEGPMFPGGDADDYVPRAEHDALKAEVEQLRQDNVRALRLITEQAERLSEYSRQDRLKEIVSKMPTEDLEAKLFELVEQIEADSKQKRRGQRKKSG